jgi:TolA-binding protein
MRSEGSRLGLLVCIVGVLAGCASAPPTQANAQTGAQNGGTSGNYEYDGWLFNSLTGKKKAGAASDATSPANQTPGASGVAPNASASGVQQTSAMTEVTSLPGPLVAGPASHSGGGKVSSALMGNSADNMVVGPPPTIPNELPSLPAGAVSIRDSKIAEEKKGFEWSDLAPESIYKNAKKAVGYGPNETFARTTMQEGKKLFLEKKYKESAAKFATAADRWPDSPLEEDALFLQGESEFFADLYSKAHDTYGGLLKKYANTRYLDTVMARQFALGRYWEQMYDKSPSWPVTPNVTDKSRPMFDTFGYAVQAYERVRLNDPTGPLADDSLMALGNAYFRRGRFEDAAYNYDLLIKEYANSEFQARAHMLGLQAKMRVYQGTLYVQGPLNDAQKLADNTLKQYGNRLGEERDRVATARAQILEEKANREYTMGEYYENRAYYGAAKMYYKSLIDEYPGTEKAKEAKVRLAAIQNKPDTPSGRLKWFTDLFESKKD